MKTMGKRFVRNAFRWLGSAGVSLALSAVARVSPAQTSSAGSIDTTVELASFDSVWAHIQRTYYDSTMRGIDWRGVRDELRPRVARATSRTEVRAAITAMLERLGESHFALLPGDAMPAASNEQAAPASARAGDAGLEVRLHEGKLLITRLDRGGPAAAAGIHTGWAIERIDTMSVAPLVNSLHRIEGVRERRLGELRLTMRLSSGLAGPAGSTVRLTMEDGTGRLVVRDLVRQPSPGVRVQMGALPPLLAHLEHWREGSAQSCVGVIRFNVFMIPVSPAFDDAMSELRSCRGIVLDLRGNVGGVAAMVMGLAGYFVDQEVSLGELRMRTSQLRYTANPRRVSRTGERIEPFAGPVAILIDELSASTTEIFAAGLQALGRAKVFGAPSAGQALPSLLMPLPNGDAVMYAIADFVAPGGLRLEGQGVVPDHAAPLTRAALLEGVDPALHAALAWLARDGGRPASSR